MPGPFNQERSPASQINDIVLERRGVSADAALRLTRYFGGEESDAQG